ncbi:enoyl-CoA hydratase/isomerase family protein [Neptunicella sp. SCSIO 80796]|uniref:enoyl-CoA hydratase/isomerase family protein n=1 Tax=Neptunicella plasticusilytica TaxID=3117012 RepID=UPI003A4DD233
MTDSILYQENPSGVATVTLNRPEKHNAFDDLLINELTQLFQKIAENPAIRVMILAANGKSFCAGADVNWMQRMAAYNYDENLADANKLALMLRTLNSMPQATIARIQGAAYGGAVGLIACCDMAVATKMSQFCLSEVKLGLVPATISPYVIEAIGARSARRYFNTAELFSARRARRLGLINESVTEEELDDTLNQLVKAVLANSPKAVTTSKQLIANVANHSINQELIDMTSRTIAAIRVSEEGQEGLSAFLQKRRPNWRGEQ